MHLRFEVQISAENPAEAQAIDNDSMSLLGSGNEKMEEERGEEGRGRGEGSRSFVANGKYLTSASHFYRRLFGHYPREANIFFNFFINIYIGHARGMRTFPGQGSNPCHSGDPSHCTHNARSLTGGTTEEPSTLGFNQREQDKKMLIKFKHT